MSSAHDRGPGGPSDPGDGYRVDTRTAAAVLFIGAASLAGLALAPASESDPGIAALAGLLVSVCFVLAYIGVVGEFAQDPRVPLRTKALVWVAGTGLTLPAYASLWELPSGVVLGTAVGAALLVLAVVEPRRRRMVATDV